MSVALYMDEHVPRIITRALRQLDVDVLTTQEDGRARTRELVLLDRVQEVSRVVVTQDTDFHAIAAQRQQEYQTFAVIIFAPQNNSANGLYINDLTLIALADDTPRYASRVQFLPL